MRLKSYIITTNNHTGHQNLKNNISIGNEGVGYNAS